MRIDKLLEEFGLAKTKGTVYLAALETGSGSVQDIAKRAGLPRTTTHEILQALTSVGLVHFVTRGRTRIYSAESPEKLKVLLKEKERKLEAALPELLSHFYTKSTRPRVRFYEGVEGVKTVFEDTLTVKNKILLGILSMEDLYKIPGKEFMDDYVNRRVGAGIKLKVIRSETKEVEQIWASSTKEARELHYAPHDMIFPMTVYLYDNKVCLIATQKENFGVIIESVDFYQTCKNLFDVLWQVTRVGKRVD